MKNYETEMIEYSLKQRGLDQINELLNAAEVLNRWFEFKFVMDDTPFNVIKNMIVDAKLKKIQNGGREIYS